MSSDIRRAEIAVLCACARRRAQVSGIGSLAIKDVDWDALLSVADAHGVTELLLAPLASANLDVPPAVRQFLEQRAIEVTGQNLSRTAELAGLMRLLSDHGVRALAFKGPSLAVGVYGHLGRRFSSDLDIFVERRHIRAIRPLLLAQGYELPPRAPRRGGSLLFGLFPAAGREDVLLPGRPGQSMLDVHVDFASWRFGIQLDPQGFFDRATTVSIAGYSIAAPCADDLLLMLAIHGMMHCWSPLRLVTDIDAVAELVTDWDAVMARAEAAGMARILWVALLLANDLLGTELPPRVATRASSDAQARALVRDAAGRMFDANTNSNWEGRRAWLRSFLDTPHRRFGFLVRDTINEWFLIWPWNSRPRRRDATNQ